MAEHSTRAHATWSASASARNFACPGALALIEAMGVVDKEGEAAAWGTACHQVAEMCLNDGKDAGDFLGARIDTKSHSFEFDEEQVECTQVFLDYVRGRMDDYEHAREFSHHPDDPAGWNIPKATLLIEQNFSLDVLLPPFDAGGTCDVVMLFPAWGLIEVVDLKTGRNWVDPRGNPQCRTYALGAALTNKGPWERVCSTIVGPRMGGEPVRSETIDLVDLLDWTTDLRAAWSECGVALACREEFKDAPADSPNQEPYAVWNKTYLHPGDHCHGTYCPAARSCPALEARALAAAHTFFQPIVDDVAAVAPPPDPRSLPIEKIIGVLDAADMIESWINAVRAYARELVEGGTKVGDYILVDKQARRKWKDDEDLPGKLTHRLGIPDDGLYERKLKSPAQIDKLAGKKGAALIADLWTKESSGVNLVRSDKTTRPAVPPPAQKFFQPITE